MCFISDEWAGKFKCSDLLNLFMFFKCLVFYLELGMEADERHGGDFGLPYSLHLGQQPLKQSYRLPSKYLKEKYDILPKEHKNA